MNKHLTRLACALSLMASLSAQAQVGMTTLPVQGRPLTLVYPTEVKAHAVDIGPFRLDIAPDAAPTPGRHRLIVMSHGTGGSVEPDHALAAALARAGFVVAQLEHEGDNFRDRRLAGPESFRRRPAEALQAIEALATHPTWSAQLDLSRIGVHGMSAGGVTAPPRTWAAAISRASAWGQGRSRSMWPVPGRSLSRRQLLQWAST